jgi:hypothetical protein
MISAAQARPQLTPLREAKLAQGFFKLVIPSVAKDDQR